MVEWIYVSRYLASSSYFSNFWMIFNCYYFRTPSHTEHTKNCKELMSHALVQILSALIVVTNHFQFYVSYFSFQNFCSIRRAKQKNKSFVQTKKNWRKTRAITSSCIVFNFYYHIIIVVTVSVSLRIFNVSVFSYNCAHFRFYFSDQFDDQLILRVIVFA